MVLVFVIRDQNQILGRISLKILEKKNPSNENFSKFGVTSTHSLRQAAKVNFPRTNVK